MLELIDHAFNQCGQIAFALRQRQCAGFEPRQPLEFVEPGENARRVACDVGRQRAIFIGRRAEQLLLDDLGKALQRVHRGAQFVQQLPDTVGFARLRCKLRNDGFGPAKAPDVAVEAPARA